MAISETLEDINKNRFTLAAIVLTAILALAAVYYVWPLADGIIFGVFFFFVTRPIKVFLDRYTKYSPYLAAFCILLPFIALIAYSIITVWGEAQWVVQHSSELEGIIGQFVAGLGLPLDINGAIDQVLLNSYDYAIGFLKSLPIGGTLSRVVSLAMNALISLFVCFYLLKDGGSFIFITRTSMSPSLSKSPKAHPRLACAALTPLPASSISSSNRPSPKLRNTSRGVWNGYDGSFFSTSG
jgi:predicted PurR-regulated permease PerM